MTAKTEYVYEVIHTDDTQGEIRYYICTEAKAAIELCINILNQDVHGDIPFIGLSDKHQFDADALFKFTSCFDFTNNIKILKIKCLTHALATSDDCDYSDYCYHTESS